MGLKILPPKSDEILLEIIMRRYENRSTLMTSNRPIEEWGKLLSDVPAASAILDRLLHHAEVIAITGRSYRLQEVWTNVYRQNPNQFFGDFRGIFFKRKGRFGGRVCRRRRECGFYSGGNFGSREPRISDLESYY